MEISIIVQSIWKRYWRIFINFLCGMYSDTSSSCNNNDMIIESFLAIEESNNEVTLVTGQVPVSNTFVCIIRVTGFWFLF